MKKKIVVLLAVLASAVGVAYAQPRAIGGRVGYGVEVSYQHALSKENMVELDLGFVPVGLQVASTYDWVFPISSWREQGAWNWYAGVGASVGFRAHDSEFTGFFGVAGRIGVEYQFWFPLQLAIDWRPVLGPHFGSSWGFDTDALWSGAFALSIRYLF